MSLCMYLCMYVFMYVCILLIIIIVSITSRDLYCTGGAGVDLHGLFIYCSNYTPCCSLSHVINIIIF